MCTHATQAGGASGPAAGRGFGRVRQALAVPRRVSSSHARAARRPRGLPSAVSAVASLPPLPALP